MNLSLILFLIGIIGFVLNRKNIILMLISIEIMLLAITLLILIGSLSFDDIIGQTYAVYIISIAGAESAIGLGILVAFYRLLFSLITTCLSLSLKIYSKNENKLNSCFSTQSSKIRASSKRLTPFGWVPLGTRNYSTKAALNNRITVLSNFTSQFSSTSQSRSTKINEEVSTIVLGLKESTLHPWFITGLFDAESSFVVTILKNSRYKTGWNVQARVQIKMYEKDRALIKAVQDYFGGIGYVSKPNKASTVEFRVSTLKYLVDVILPHFDKYPLISKKRTDYLLFKQIVLLMSDEAHHTLIGIQKIVNIRASLNTGITDNLKEAFPNWKAVSTKDLESNTKNKVYNNLHPDWLAGFATGESNFFIVVQKAKTKSGIATSLRFSIAQHSRDLFLLKSFVNLLGCGSVVNYTKRPICEFIVTKINFISEYIIPFFDKHPILGSKHLNYLDFKSAAYIIKNKEHLNEDGVSLNHILQLKKKNYVTIIE